MNKKVLASIVAVVLFIAVLIIISVNDTEKLETRNDSIKVGTILGLTGQHAAYGEKMKIGFEYALSQINSSGGINGKKVELVIEDSAFDPDKAVSAYQKLHGFQGIQIIVGITGSKNALPVCQAAKTDNVVIIDALGSAPKLTTHGGPNYYRVMASDALAGQYNVEWAIENQMKQPCIIYIEDEWGVSYKNAIVKHLDAKGIVNIAQHGISDKTRDYRTQIEKLRNEKPDTIFLLLYAKQGSAFMQQLRQANISTEVYGSDNISSTEFISSGNAAVEGVRVAMPTPASGSVYNSFVGSFKEKYGYDPDANIIKSYDAIKLVAMLMNKVGADPQIIKATMLSPDFEYEGISGTIKFDTNGDLVSQNYTRMIYSNGKLIPMN